MGEAANAPATWLADDPAAVLHAVLAGVGRTGSDVLCVLRPVRASGGAVVDLVVVADSGMLARLAGAPAVGRRVRELLPADLAERMVTVCAQVMRTGTVTRGDLALARAGSGTVVLPADGPDQHHPVGEVVRIPSEGFVVLLGREVTEARAGRRALLASEQRYRRLVEHSGDPILVATPGGVLTYASPAVRAVVHREPDELLGAPVSAIAHPDDAAACRDLLADAVAAPAGESRSAQLRTCAPDGAVGTIAVTATNWVDDPAVAGVVLNVHDVTEQRAAEERLLREALQDSLTGLANRRWFMRALEEAVSRGERTGAPYAVLVIDVDGFKGVNDSLGHPAGDALLVELARRLTGALRPSDTAARLGGDEFVVIAQDLHDAGDARTVARRVLERCTGPYDLPGVDRPVPVTVSIGLATSVNGAPGAPEPAREHGPAPGAGDEAAPGGPAGAHAARGTALFGRADAALYRAKRHGRNRIETVDGVDLDG